MIDSYSFGTITIDGKRYVRDLIIFPDHITTNWRRESGHFLVEDDIREVLEYKPELLIIGTGASGLMKVDGRLKEKLKELKIDFLIVKTAEAVEEYNRVYKMKRTVCALHLTC